MSTARRNAATVIGPHETLHVAPKTLRYRQYRDFQAAEQLQKRFAADQNPSKGSNDTCREYGKLWYGERSVYSPNTCARALVGNAPERLKSGVRNRTLDTQSKR